MHRLLDASLLELRDRLRCREVSPVELNRAVLERIDERNPEINALVSMREPEAILDDARTAEQRILANRARPLEGIPFGVKDLEDVAGMITSHGSLAFADHRASRDSVQVERLRAAGAIVVGKTNTSEFGATAVTKNPLFGVTTNPWSELHSPGGSSGGSAAAIAGGLLPIATAADGGGSIRIPACLVGAFGLKPSIGRIPIGPSDHWIMNDLDCYGPITRTVEDAALLLDQVVGASEWDPASLPHPGRSYLEALREPPARGLRVAFSLDLGYAVVQHEVEEAVTQAVKVIADLGHDVEPLPENPPTLGVAWVKLGAYEMAARLSSRLPEDRELFGRGFIDSVMRGANLRADKLDLIMRERARLTAWCADLFTNFDLLLTPTVPFDGMPARGPYPPELDGRASNPMSIGSFTIPFNFSGHPAATVRVGLSSRGLPMGMQIIAPQHREDRVLEVAHAFETQRPWNDVWPS